MMNNLIIARYGEIHLKGDNRGYFLRTLKRNLECATGANVLIENGRVFITQFDNLNKTVIKTANTFGIVSVSPAVEIESDSNDIINYLKTVKVEGSFKVEVNRADKSFTYTSQSFAAIAGGVILDLNQDAQVDLHNPKTVIYIDIRKRTYIYSEIISGVGGLPVGTAGRALVMLSGGIDSPVAAFLAAKRGLSIDCLHFASPPFTSEFALEKVRDLVGKLENFCGKIRLFIVPFTEIQEAIRDNCPSEFMITIMRRFMVRIAERVALDNKIECIITGENLSQVASQTVAGITSNNVCAQILPILRPLVMFDKGEIISIARKIDTYDISCRPHLDCCTVFVPKHPSIHPKISRVEQCEQNLDMNALLQNAINKIIV